MKKKTQLYIDWRYTNWASLENRLRKFTHSSNILALNYEEKVYPGLCNGDYLYINTKNNVLRALNGKIDGLLGAFVWSGTKEGHKYWADEYNKLRISDHVHTRLLQIYFMKG